MIIGKFKFFASHIILGFIREYAGVDFSLALGHLRESKMPIGVNIPIYLTVVVIR